MYYTKAVGKRLKEQNLTQTDFATKSNISRITINRTINGKVDVVTFETLLAFCKTLDISLKAFFASELFNEDIEFYKKKKGKRI